MGLFAARGFRVVVGFKSRFHGWAAQVMGVLGGQVGRTPAPRSGHAALIPRVS